MVKDQERRRLFPGEVDGICHPGLEKLPPHGRADDQLGWYGDVVVQVKVIFGRRNADGRQGPGEKAQGPGDPAFHSSMPR